MGRWIRSARGVLFDFRLIVECFQYGLVTTRTTRWRHPFGRRPIPVALGALGNTTTHVGNRTLPVPPASWSSNRISSWKGTGAVGRQPILAKRKGRARHRPTVQRARSRDSSVAAATFSQIPKKSHVAHRHSHEFSILLRCSNRFQ